MSIQSLKSYMMRCCCLLPVWGLFYGCKPAEIKERRKEAVRTPDAPAEPIADSQQKTPRVPEKTVPEPLKTEVQKAYDAIIMRNQGDALITSLIKILYANPQFTALSEAERRSLLYLFSGKNPLSVDARARMKEAAFETANAAAQSQFLLAVRTPRIALLPLSAVTYASSQYSSGVPATTWPRGANWAESPSVRYMISLSFAGGKKLQIPVDYQKVENTQGWIAIDRMALALAAMPYELARCVPAVRVSDFTGANASTGPKDGVIDYGAKNSPHPPRTITHEAGHAANRFFASVGVTNALFDRALVDDGGLMPSSYAASAFGERIGELAVLYTETMANGPFRNEYLEMFPAQLQLFEETLAKIQNSKP